MSQIAKEEEEEEVVERWEEKFNHCQELILTLSTWFDIVSFYADADCWMVYELEYIVHLNLFDMDINRGIYSVDLTH